MIIKPSSFPQQVLSPLTHHGLPCPSLFTIQKSKAITAHDFMHLLRSDDINAFAFLMSQAFEVQLMKKGISNDPEKALVDLKNQLPPDVREKYFPSPPPPPSGGGGGGGSANGGGDSDGGLPGAFHPVPSRYSRRRSSYDGDGRLGNSHPSDWPKPIHYPSSPGHDDGGVGGK